MNLEIAASLGQKYLLDHKLPDFTSLIVPSMHASAGPPTESDLTEVTQLKKWRLNLELAPAAGEYAKQLEIQLKTLGA